MKEDLKGSKDLLENKLQSQVVEVQSNQSSKDEETNENPTKRKKGLKKDLKSKEIEVIDETFNIYSRGKIDIAEKHRSANRPKREIADLTEEEENIHICPCCGLSEEVNGKLEFFKTCDNPDDFSNCGQGVVLYYDYIKFVIIISFIATIGMTFFNSYFSYKYYYEMTKICNNYYNDEFKPSRIKHFEECEFYMTDSGIDEEDIKHIETFFFQFSSVNIEDYRKIYKKLYEGVPNFDKDAIEPTIINLSLVNFITLIVLFVFNLIYIYFLFNKGNAADYLVFSVSDYAVFLTNLYDLYNKFKENLQTVKEKEELFKKKGKTIEAEWYNSILGFKPEEGMIEIKMV